MLALQAEDESAPWCQRSIFSLKGTSALSRAHSPDRTTSPRACRPTASSVTLGTGASTRTGGEGHAQSTAHPRMVRVENAHSPIRVETCVFDCTGRSGSHTPFCPLFTGLGLRPVGVSRNGLRVSSQLCRKTREGPCLSALQSSPSRFPRQFSRWSPAHVEWYPALLVGPEKGTRLSSWAV